MTFVALLVAGCGGPPGPSLDSLSTPVTIPPASSGAPAVTLALSKVVDGLEEPTHLALMPDGSLAVTEQPGIVRLLRDGRLLADPLLDIEGKVRSGGERGLLGLAFDPEDGSAFYVYYTDDTGDIVVERYRMAGSRADAGTGQEVLRVPHREHSNHNGGMLAFGPDGYLYVGTGDGGSAGDPDNRAQDKHDLLGKILRIDVRGIALDDVYRPLPYGIPKDNPFADGENGAAEVWAYGLRNPWRFSFDRETGDLWIGDVGQNAYEEVNMEPAGDPGGRNYGWSAYEGTHRYDDDREAPGAVMPVAEISQSETGSCSVIGGYVYRGKDIPGLQGTYLFSDYCSGLLWTLRKEGDQWVDRIVLETGLSVSSFGQDADGELYLVDLGGSVHRIISALG